MADALRKAADLYEKDFFAWTQDQAAKLRARASFDNRGDIDWENAAEEIESVGRSDKREIRTRLGVLLKHLLKWRHQPDLRSESWIATIAEQRRAIEAVREDSPSLHSAPSSALSVAYGRAIRDAARETGIPRDRFPSDCPFTIEEILDLDFYPDGVD